MTLREAIITVLTTKYKKDAPEAFKMVKEAGYRVEKTGMAWAIKNPDTNRILYAQTRFDWDAYDTVWEIFYNWNKRPVPVNNTAFDAVAFLNTPLRPKYEAFVFSKAKSVYQDIEHHKYWIDNYNRKMEEAQEAIRRAQRDLVYYAQRAKEEEIKLNNVREANGLKRR